MAQDWQQALHREDGVVASYITLRDHSPSNHSDKRL